MNNNVITTTSYEDAAIMAMRKELETGRKHSVCSEVESGVFMVVPVLTQEEIDQWDEHQEVPDLNVYTTIH